jgi:hypothetical protein
MTNGIITKCKVYTEEWWVEIIREIMYICKANSILRTCACEFRGGKEN